MTNQQGAPEALLLADQYAAAHAKWALEDLYGSSKSYTAVKLAERHAARKTLEKALRAQQPAPAEVVYSSPEEMFDAILTPQPSPTPQADSQPAPDEIISMAREQGLPETEIEGVFRVNIDDLGRMFAAYRAARAPADSVTAPAGGVVAGPEWKWVPADATDDMVRATDKVNFENEDTDGTIHNVWNTMLAAAPTPPAQAADSVLEDAARLDWLDQQCEAYGFQDIHEGNRWEIGGPYANVRIAIDAGRADRKQGANHD